MRMLEDPHCVPLACARTVKVLQVHWKFGLGGVAKYAVALQKAARFSQIGIESLCILAPQWPTDTETLRSLPHSIIPVSGPTDLSWRASVAAEIYNRKPDLIMSHGFNAHFVLLMCQLMFKRPIPWICSYHGQYHAPSAMKRLLAPLYNRLTERILRRYAIGVVTVADRCRCHLLARGVPAERIEVIHNGVDDRPPVSGAVRKRKREQWGLPREALVVGLASRLDPVKGTEFLLDAVSRLHNRYPAITVVVLGDGVERSALARQSFRLGIDKKVHFLGRQSDVPDAMGAFDIFALPSLEEYHSIALLEAMRAGLPIVATNVGGNPESIEREKEGLFVAPRDAAALAAAIERLVEDPEMAERLGRAARARFLKEFTEQVMVRKTAQWLIGCAEKVQRDGRFSWLRQVDAPYCLAAAE